jgi:hypothetical protein
MGMAGIVLEPEPAQPALVLVVDDTEIVHALVRGALETKRNAAAYSVVFGHGLF